jgi:hypothetical protein
MTNGSYSGSIGGCGSPQAMVDQSPRYDRKFKKRVRKKKKDKHGR